MLRFRYALLWLTGERILWLASAVIVFIIVLVPLGYSFDAAFYRETRIGLSPIRSLAAFLDVYTSGEYYGFLASTLILATIVTACSLVVGVLMALIVARTDLRHKALCEIFIIMPLFMSPFTGLIAWVALGAAKSGFINVTLNAIAASVGITLRPLVNIWTYGGIIWVMVIFFCPFVYLFTIGSLRMMDAALEEAARMTGSGTLKTLLRVTLPLTLPATLAAGLLVFVLTSEIYSIPGLIGATIDYTTLPWKIFTDATQTPVHRAHAAAAGSLLLLVTVAGVLLQRIATSRSERYVTVSGKGFRGRPLPLGRWRWPAILFIFAYIACADLLPFGALLLQSFMRFSASSITAAVLTLDHYRQIISLVDVRNALWNTVLLSVLTAIACTLIGLLISAMEFRKPTAARQALAFLGVLPVAVPGVVYGVGLLWTYLRTPLYGTVWILLMAYVAKFLPYGILISRSGLMQIHPELEQSARVTGAGGLTTLRRITMPLLKPALIAIAVFVMLNTIKELSASLLLYNTQSNVLSVLTWQYMDAGDYQFAATLGVVQTVLMFVLVVVTRAVFNVQLEKAMAKS